MRSYSVLFMQHWSKLEHPVGEPRPVGRSAHAAACLGYGGDRPQLLVIGGLAADNKLLDDAWLLDVKSKKWREVKITWLTMVEYRELCTG